MSTANLMAQARRVVAALKAQGFSVATAESCTGGMVAELLTSVPGSSSVVECGFVTYSNAAKMRMLGVPAELIEKHGAVSAEVAGAMAEGALANSMASLSVAITGIAGPDGGSAEKPVGLVHLALATRGGTTHHLVRRYGAQGRTAVRYAIAADALMLLERASLRHP